MTASALPPPRVPEQLLIDCLSDMAARKILCTTAGWCQFAVAAAQQFPAAAIHCLFLDLYHALQNGQRLGLPVTIEHGLAHSPASIDLSDAPLANFSLHCATDFPDIEADCVALPLSASGEGELARDLLQTGHQRLHAGGWLLAATDNPRDSWLQQELRKLPGKLQRRAARNGVVYLLQKTEPLRKLKNFSCEFVFRDRERLLRGFSRPGVFSHRHVDPGARRLMEVMELRAGERVLEIGCGSGAASLAAATRVEQVTVRAIDSAARAVACTRRGAELNELPGVSAQLDATGDVAGLGTYDLALANPPYYAHFRIAEHFVQVAERALAAGGRLLLVTKQPDWYAEHLPARFDDVQLWEIKGYYVASAVQRS